MCKNEMFFLAQKYMYLLIYLWHISEKRVIPSNDVFWEVGKPYVPVD